MYLNIGMLRYQVCNCQGRVLCVVVQQLILVLLFPDTDWVYNNLQNCVTAVGGTYFTVLCDNCHHDIVTLLCDHCHHDIDCCVTAVIMAQFTLLCDSCHHGTVYTAV